MRGIQSYQPPRYNFNRFCHRLAALLKPEAGIELPRARIVIPQEVKLVDTSHWEGLMDVPTFVTSDAQGIICKASQGLTIDDQFHNTWSHFKGVRPRGCFCFFDPQYSPTSQLNTFLSAFGDDPGELPLVVDWEAGWTGSYSGWSNLYGFLEGLKKAVPGHPIDIYTGYYYWLDHSPNPITQASSLAYFKQFNLWLAWYAAAAYVKIPKPWDTLEFWQYTDSGNGKLYGTESNAIDLDWYSGTQEQWNTTYGGGVVPPPPPPPAAIVIKRPLSEVDIQFTPGSGEMLLMSAVEQARQFGWDAVMNGGAGFSYTKTGNLEYDKTHAIPKSAGFQTVNGIPYARRLLTAGVVNPELADNPNLAPWSILAFDAANVYLIVTIGLEGQYGMTQTQAAQWCASHGLVDAYLMDSGRSSQIEENGMTLYWPYAPNEKVPQCIGLKAKATGGTMDYKVIWPKGAGERAQPNTSGSSFHTYLVNEIITGVVQNNIPDSSDPGNVNKRWCKLGNGHYVATNYPDGAGVPSVRLELVSAPPPPTVTLTHTIETYSDGSLKVDGNVIP